MFRFHFRAAIYIVVGVVAVLAAGCNFSPPSELPVVQEASPSPTATLIVPSATATAALPAVTAIIPADTPTPVPPSMTPTITDTPGPFEHVIQPGDQLLAIVQQYGHFDPAVLDVIVQMNANITDPDRLPPPGSVILIPRPTPSATPAGGELTATVVAQHPPTATPEILTMMHTVEEGQTIIGIALQYNTTMLILRLLNPDLDWRGCDFSVASGGQDCNPPLSIGQELVVPAPTPTPTLSPTPSGSETPTPTPTFGPVRLLSPTPGSIVVGGPLTLRWVSAGVLRGDELYQVTVADHTTGRIYTQFTRDNILTLPADLQPADSSPHDMTWQVVVVRVRDDNRAQIVGALGEERPFQWVAP